MSSPGSAGNPDAQSPVEPSASYQMTRSLHETAGRAVALFSVLLLAGCAGEYPQSSISPHSDFAEIIHSLYVSIFWWTMLIMAVVWVALAWVLVRYRRRPDDDRPRQIRGHLGLEIGWTVGPALIVIAIAIPTIQAVFATQRPISEDAMLVEVTGHRFWWEFHYPEYGVTTANELRLPVDRPVNLRLESNDVIHSFWIPMLGGKRDLNPVPEVREGREKKYNWLYFTPQVTGVYMGQCAEFCGESHALMAKRIIVETEEGFETWVESWFASEGAAPLEAADPADADALVQLPGGGVEETPPTVDPTADTRVAQGRELFLNSTCIACHAVQGTSAQGIIAPNLTLFGSRLTLAAGIMENNEENLVRWIKDPQGIKPASSMPGVDSPGGNWPATGFSDDEVRAIAAYLLSLK
jgi:cytochrome c oxidase subunit II